MSAIGDKIKALATAVWEKVKRQPALIVSAATAVISYAGVVGFSIPDHDAKLIISAATFLSGVITWFFVTPNATVDEKVAAALATPPPQPVQPQPGQAAG